MSIKNAYRGKPPYNDMKAERLYTSKLKNAGKWKAEYDKLGSKEKYSYLRSTGYQPRATAKLTFSGTSTTNKICTIISSDGTSKAYVAKGTESLTSDPPQWAGGTSAAANATSLAKCINASTGHGGKIFAEADGAVVNITQLQPGPDGNTTISENESNLAITNNFSGG